MQISHSDGKHIQPLICSSRISLLAGGDGGVNDWDNLFCPIAITRIRANIPLLVYSSTATRRVSGIGANETYALQRSQGAVPLAGNVHRNLIRDT